MRIPDRHKLSLEFVKQFLKMDLTDLWEFVNYSDKTLLFINDVKKAREFADKDQMRTLKFLNENESDPASGMNSDEIFESCVEHYIRRECNLPNFKLKEIDENSSDDNKLEEYHKIRRALDSLSLRRFLKEEAYLSQHKDPAMKLSGAAQDFVLLLESLESLLSASMTAILDDLIALKSEKYFQIPYGMDKLPKSLAEKMSGSIRYNERVTEIERLPGATTEGIVVRHENRITKKKGEKRFDLVVLSIPFTSLRQIKTPGFVDFRKRRAIRQLHYDNACKIVLEFSKPFWSHNDIEGGNSITDLPVRRIFYPVKNQINTGDQKICVACFWRVIRGGADSARWTSLNEHERMRQALDDVAQVHKINDLDSRCIGGMTYSWQEDEFACGAFALFEPRQLVDLFRDVWRPSDLFHFCGEHTSLKHGWIEGAIESGIRCAVEICHRISSDKSLSLDVSPLENPYLSR